MANTPFMNLNLPVPTITIGPLWATEINTAIEAIDEHDHTSTKGKQIPTAAININANLDLNSFTPFNALSLKFSSQVATLTGASNASSIYVVNGNLYFTNSAGNAVQITSSGALFPTPGSVQAFNRFSVSGNITLSSSDDIVVLSVNTNAVRTITLPVISSLVDGRFYIFKDETGLSYDNPIIIAPNGTDTIDKVASPISLDSSFGSVMIIADGTSNWQIA